MTSIIIPVFNNINYTKDCIESIYKNTTPDIFEIIVVDNRSTDGTSEYLLKLSKRYNNFFYIRNDANLGFAKACNIGAKKATSDKILFLNNDTIVLPNWLESLVKEMKENPEAKILGSKLLYEDNTVQHAGVVFIDTFSIKNNKSISQLYNSEATYAYHIYRSFPSVHPAVNKKRFFQCVTGACLMIYKDLFFELGMFDEIYLNGVEDVELCLRAGEKGIKALYCPESVVYHYESKTPGRHVQTAENEKIFFQRWSNKIVPDEQKYFEEDGFILRGIKAQKYYQNDGVLIKEFTLITKCFEKTFDNPKCLIISKNNKKSDISDCADFITFIESLQINTESQFNLCLIDNIEYERYKYLYENIFEINNFNEFINLIKSTTIDKIYFLSPSEKLKYQWDLDFEYIDRKHLMEIIDSFEKINFQNGDFKILEKLQSLFNEDMNFLLLLAQNYQKNSMYKESLDILGKIIKNQGKNKFTTSLILKSIESLGDFKTAEKLKSMI